MKRIAMLTLPLFGLLLLVGGCKKGDGDPFISLKSRKARLTGEWVVTSIEWTETTTSGGSSDTDTYSYNEGGNMVVNTSNFEAEYRIDEFKYVFNKDYTYEYMLSLTLMKVDGNTVPDSSQTQYTEKTTGTWTWLGKSKSEEWKNKERIMITTLTRETTDDGQPDSFSEYSGVQDGQIMAIEQLKNKEMIVYVEGTTTDEENDITYESDQTFVLTKQ